MSTITLDIDELPTKLFDDVMRFLHDKKHNQLTANAMPKLHFGSLIRTYITLKKHDSWEDFFNNPGKFKVIQAADKYYSIRIDTPNFNGVLYVYHDESHSDNYGHLDVQIDPMYLNQLRIDLKDDFDISTYHCTINDNPYGFYSVVGRVRSRI